MSGLLFRWIVRTARLAQDLARDYVADDFRCALQDADRTNFARAALDEEIRVVSFAAKKGNRLMWCRADHIAFTVMAGLVPAIHSSTVPRWMAGTSPAMTC